MREKSARNGMTNPMTPADRRKTETSALPTVLDDETLTEQDLRSRTEHLLLAAEKVSIQLVLQTERLAEAIDLFDREIIAPLREGLK